MVWRYAYCFFRILKLFFITFFAFLTRHFSSPYTTDMYMEYIPCIGNSSYSFWRILLKLYSCFQDGLKICILFFQDPEIFFFHFNLDIFSSLYATDMYREYMPCIGNPAYSFRPILLKLYRYFAAFLWFHMRNLSLAGYNCSGGASCMACSFIGLVMRRLKWLDLKKWISYTCTVKVFRTVFILPLELCVSVWPCLNFNVLLSYVELFMQNHT